MTQKLAHLIYIVLIKGTEYTNQGLLRRAASAAHRDVRCLFRHRHRLVVGGCQFRGKRLGCRRGARRRIRADLPSVWTLPLSPPVAVAADARLGICVRQRFRHQSSLHHRHRAQGANGRGRAHRRGLRRECRRDVLPAVKNLHSADCEYLDLGRMSYPISWRSITVSSSPQFLGRR